MLGPLSSYTYFAPPEGPGFPGCIPHAYECDFSLEGNLQLTIAADQTTAKFVGGPLIATGNSTVFGPGGFDLAAPGGALLSIDLVRVDSSSSVLEFRDSRFREQGINPYTMLVQIDGGRLSIAGGVDLTAVDGDGFELSVQGVVVPEPSCTALVAAACVLMAAAKLRRHKPS